MVKTLNEGLLSATEHQKEFPDKSTSPNKSPTKISPNSESGYLQSIKLQFGKLTQTVEGKKADKRNRQILQLNKKVAILQEMVERLFFANIIIQNYEIRNKIKKLHQEFEAFYRELAIKSTFQNLDAVDKKIYDLKISQDDILSGFQGGLQTGFRTSPKEKSHGSDEKIDLKQIKILLNSLGIEDFEIRNPSENRQEHPMWRDLHETTFSVSIRPHTSVSKSPHLHLLRLDISHEKQQFIYHAACYEEKGCRKVFIFHEGNRDCLETLMESSLFIKLISVEFLLNLSFKEKPVACQFFIEGEDVSIQNVSYSSNPLEEEAISCFNFNQYIAFAFSNHDPWTASFESWNEKKCEIRKSELENFIFDLIRMLIPQETFEKQQLFVKTIQLLLAPQKSEKRYTFQNRSFEIVKMENSKNQILICFVANDYKKKVSIRYDKIQDKIHLDSVIPAVNVKRSLKLKQILQVFELTQAIGKLELLSAQRSSISLSCGIANADHLENILPVIQIAMELSEVQGISYWLEDYAEDIANLFHFENADELKIFLYNNLLKNSVGIPLLYAIVQKGISLGYCYQEVFEVANCWVKDPRWRPYALIVFAQLAKTLFRSVEIHSRLKENLSALDELNESFVRYFFKQIESIAHIEVYSPLCIQVAEKAFQFDAFYESGFELFKQLFGVRVGYAQAVAIAVKMMETDTWLAPQYYFKLFQELFKYGQGAEAFINSAMAMHKNGKTSKGIIILFQKLVTHQLACEFDYIEAYASKGMLHSEWDIQQEALRLFTDLFRLERGFKIAEKTIKVGIKYTTDPSNYLELLQALFMYGKGFQTAIQIACKFVLSGKKLEQKRGVLLFSRLFQKGQGYQSAVDCFWNLIYDQPQLTLTLLKELLAFFEDIPGVIFKVEEALESSSPAHQEIGFQIFQELIAMGRGEAEALRIAKKNIFSESQIKREMALRLFKVLFSFKKGEKEAIEVCGEIENYSDCLVQISSYKILQSLVMHDQAFNTALNMASSGINQHSQLILKEIFVLLEMLVNKNQFYEEAVRIISIYLRNGKPPGMVLGLLKILVMKGTGFILAQEVAKDILIQRNWDCHLEAIELLIKLIQRNQGMQLCKSICDSSFYRGRSNLQGALDELKKALENYQFRVPSPNRKLKVSQELI